MNNGEVVFVCQPVPPVQSTFHLQNYLMDFDEILSWWRRDLQQNLYGKVSQKWLITQNIDT